jgi:hypothetical protein
LIPHQNLGKRKWKKELFASMVERLNKDKEQLMAYLMTKSQTELVFEADVRHFELSSETRQPVLDVVNPDDPRENRIKSLETEKELLAGMLEKLSRENERLMAHIRNDHEESVFDVSYDEVAKVAFDSTIKEFADVSCETEEAFYSPRPVWIEEAQSPRRDQFDDSSTEHTQELSSFSTICGDSSTVEQISDRSISFVSCVEGDLADPKKTESKQGKTLAFVHGLEPGHGEDFGAEESKLVLEIENLRSQVNEISAERDHARSRFSSAVGQIAAVIGASEQLTGSFSDEMSRLDSVVSAIENYTEKVRQQAREENSVVVRQLETKISELEVKNEIALEEVRNILTEVEVEASASEVPCVSVADAFDEQLPQIGDLASDLVRQTDEKQVAVLWRTAEHDSSEE